MKKSNDIVFDTLRQILSNCPAKSYTRLNGALYSTLYAAIGADLPFQRATFERIYRQLRGAYWFGDGAGSHIGEGFYNHAIECNHASAIQSFEAFANRPAVLWEENSAQPERLCIGARFTWKGYWVKVTSMRAVDLVACTYKDVCESPAGIDEGAIISDYRSRDNKHWLITSRKRTGTGYTLRVAPTPGDDGSSTVARRFTITYAEIAEFRRTEAKRVKAIIDAITTCNPATDAKALNKRVSDGHFRHFQLEKIKAAWTARLKDATAADKAALNQQRIQVWREGANGAYLEVEENLLRVKGDQVQCSNGNCVSVAAVRRALPVVLDHRTQSGTLTLPLDGHTIKGTDAKGVTVGCTFVRWSEVERLQVALKHLPICG
jgi:hypothetical protein